MKGYIFFVLFLIVFSLFLTHPVYAIAETSGDIQVTYDEPMFPSSTIWYPGLIVSKSFTVKNIDGSTHTASMKADNTSQTGDMATVMLYKVNEGVIDHYGGFNDKSMKNFWDTGEVDLSDIAPNDATTYTVTISMPSNLGNEYQGKKAVFDLIVGFVGTASTVTISSGETVSGATTVCNDTKPGSAPVLQSAVAGVNSVTLNWTEGSDPISYYLIAYGVSPNNSTYGNTNIGGKDTTHYTVSGLSGGITYCFIVRAGNGCKPGDFSNQICTTPAGGFLTAAVAPGFSPNVLGVSTPEAQLSSSPNAAPTGEIKGATTKHFSISFIIKLLLLAISLFLLLFYFFFLKKNLPNSTYMDCL